MRLYLIHQWVSEGGRHYPLYSYDYTELFEGPALPRPPPPMNLRDRLQLLVPRMQWQDLGSWFHVQNTPVISAESQLREILDRHQSGREPRSNHNPDEDSTDMYG